MINPFEFLTFSTVILMVSGVSTLQASSWVSARVVGVPSASAARDSRKHPVAHYQLYGIEKAGNGWRVEVAARGFDPGIGAFKEARSYTL